MSGTPFSVPGWYINFQAAVIKQLPRPGELTEAMVKAYESSQGVLKEKLSSCLLPRQDSVSVPLSTPPDDFAVLADLGIVTVPNNGSVLLADLATDGYGCHLTFERGINRGIDIHQPGEKYWVRAVKPRSRYANLSELLKKSQAKYLGINGISLVLRTAYNKLPKGYRYISLSSDKIEYGRTIDEDHYEVYAHEMEDRIFGVNICLTEYLSDKKDYAVLLFCQV